jgi:hypothetical protein
MLLEYLQAMHADIVQAIEKKFEYAWRVVRIKEVSHSFYSLRTTLTGKSGTRVQTTAEFRIECVGNVAAFVDPLPRMRCRAYLAEDGLHLDMESVGIYLGEQANVGNFAHATVE